MKTNFNWGDDVIDSRMVIARHEELQDEYDSLVSALEDAKNEVYLYNKNPQLDDESDEEVYEKLDELNTAVDDAQEALDEFNSSYDKDELDLLTEVIEQGEDSPDWAYGEGLILDSYFTQYIEELVNDCWGMPKEMNEGKWPFNHLTMDWEAAADEARSDYLEIEAGGLTYFIRA